MTRSTDEPIVQRIMASQYLPLAHRTNAYRHWIYVTCGARRHHSCNPAKAKQLLAAAGYPNGLDAGDFVPIPGCTDVSEAVVNDLSTVGTRVKMRTMERAAFLSAWRESAL